jgi:16S rRNA (cytosine967-C5)-methyltransferase
MMLSRYASCMATPAREVAYDILLRVEQQDAYASELLHGGRLESLSPDDRNLATEIVMGTLRWRARLDFGIAAVSKEPLHKLDKEVLTALRVGAYQIGWLRLPARAAVNESVELVKRARFRYSAPYVNAVLRKIAAKPELMEPVLSPGPKTVVDIAALYSHPLWLVERWGIAYGLETAEKICAYDQEVPPTAIRLSLAHPSKNSQGGASEVLVEELKREGIELAPGALLKSTRCVVKGDVTHTKVFAEGRVAIQDEASQLVALLVGTGERLLDCCAAPGGKTAILAERNPQARIVAAELHPQRAELMKQRLASAKNVQVVTADVADLPPGAGFDRVLADVPCSGTGTLARNPEIKWRLKVEDLADLHARQVGILTAAIERLRPGGRVVYSSCSLEPEENEGVVEEVLRTRADVRVADAGAILAEIDELFLAPDQLVSGSFLRTTPGVHPCDGFFAAVMCRP